MNLTAVNSKLHRDFSADVQPKGSPRFVLNGINESSEGDQNYITNEQANELFAKLNPGFEVIGSRYLEGNRTVVFSTNGTNSEIGIIDKNRYEPIITSECLGFNSCFPIDVIYRVRRGCEDTIYFTDGLNPVRRINLFRLDRYFSEDYETWIETNDPDDFVGEKWDCNAFKLFPDFEIACIVDTEVITGGGRLRLGAYEFAIQYLDADANPTNWFYASLPVAIHRDQDGGGFNIDVDPINGFPEESKSIKLTLVDIDQDFTHYRVAIIPHTSGTGAPETVLVSNPIPISVNTFTYTGDNSGFTQTTVEEIRQPKLDLATAKHIDQIENRMILANTTGKQLDWCRFQTYASRIGSQYVVTQTSKSDAVTLDDTYYVDLRSYMRDEIYAFAIVWIFTDGSTSNAFHIPGRALLAQDQTVYEYVEADINGNPVGTVSDPSHIPFYIYPNTPDKIALLGMTFLFWEKFESSVQLDDDPNYFSNGLNQYTQCDVEYPELFDCEEERMYPVGPIRHHKLPSNKKEFHQDEENIYPIGLKFSNIEPPPEFVNEVVGYYIVRAKRDASTKTVLTKGIRSPGRLRPPVSVIPTLLTPFNTIPVNYVLSAQEDRSEWEIFVSPETQFNQIGVANNTLRNYYEIDVDTTNFEIPHDIIVPPLNISSVTDQIVDEAFYVNPDQVFITPGGDPIVNLLRNMPLLFLKTDFEENAIFYEAIIQDIQPYCNLEAIQYYRTHNCVLDGTENAVYGGDIFIAPFNYRWCQFEANDQVKNGVWRNHLMKTWIETEINTPLRHTSNQECIDCFKLNIVPDEDPFCPSEFFYNSDYSVQACQNIYGPLPFNYDCCSACQEVHPNRVYYSEQSFQEELSDNYGVFLPNNSRDIEGQHGEITDIFTQNNNLFIHTKENLWQLPQQFQERVTDEIVSFIGTGEFFTIPPRKIMDAETGAAGTQDKWATQKTKYGIFFVDQQDATPYLLTQGVQSIAGGMSNWFEENMRPILRCQLDKLGVGYCCDSPEVGMISIFDPRHDRIVLTKRDYEIIESKWGGATEGMLKNQRNGRLYFDLLSCQFYTVSLPFGAIKVVLGNPTFFCDKSWTLSYSFITNDWVSFHSYIPDWYISTKEDFFSTQNDGIWKHHIKGKYQTYYGVHYPHIIELVSNSSAVETRVWSDLQWLSEAKIYDPNTKSYRDDRFATFNKIWLYNNYQFSGELTLRNKNDIGQFYLHEQVQEVQQTLMVDRNERNFSINDFRNLVTEYDETLFDTSCVDFKQTDKNVNTVINYGKNWWEQEVFRDKYLVMRFILDNRDDLKITTKYVIENEQISER